MKVNTNNDSRLKFARVMLFVTITIINILVMKMEFSRSSYCFAAQLEK